MKAIVYTEYGSPEVLHIKEVEKPVPRDNEVLIRIIAAAVSTADSAARKGEKFIERLAFGLSGPKKPILGTEFSGKIEIVGKAVTRFKEGDQVFAASGLDFGAHAEYLCLPEEGALAIKPDNISFQEAAAISEGGLTALPFLRDLGELKRGQKILINGASGVVGAYAVQLAKYYGADVTAVCSTANFQMVTALGADKVVDYRTQDFTVSGQTYDVIFDAVGKRTFSQCKPALKKTGVYLTTVPTLSIMFDLLRTAKFSRKKARIMFAGLRSSQAKSRDLVFLRERVEAGELKPVIDICYALKQISEAHSHVDTGHKKGNIIISF